MNRSARGIPEWKAGLGAPAGDTPRFETTGRGSVSETVLPRFPDGFY